MKLKVLHIINCLTIGGAEILLVNSLTPGGLQEHTDNVLVYLQGTSELEERVDKRVKIYSLNYKGILSLPSTFLKLRKIIKDNKIDIIHSHLTPTSFYTNLARPKNIPQVHTLHIAYSTDLETRRELLMLERKLFYNKKYCNLVFLSDFTKADFLRTVKFTGKPFVLNNFIADHFFDHHPKLYHGSAAKGLKVISVGNFREQKNYAYLLKIFGYLKSHNIHLDIYGGGAPASYKQQIIDNGLNVEVKGAFNNIEKVIADYDLFIMSSTNEGYPLSIFEAMAAGVPLILSDIAPLRIIVKDNALYFKLDNAKATANMLLDILHNKIDISRMAAKAKLYAEKTAKRNIYIKKLLEIYGQVLN